MEKNAHIIIPARLASARLAKKPLADICGKPMICRVLDRALEALGDKKRIAAAVDSEEIAKQVRAAGFNAIMTDPALPSGSDRVAAAADFMGLDDTALIVNLQGDEPAMPPALLKQIIEILERNKAIEVATLAALAVKEDLTNPNIVKLVRSDTGKALYFSRAPIPFNRDIDNEIKVQPLRHIGLYAYRLAALRAFVSLPLHPLEETEKLEQLRLLAADIPIHVGLCKAPPHGVDTVEQLEAMRQRVWD